MNMEDALCVQFNTPSCNSSHTPSAFFGVFDGHGGPACSEFLSRGTLLYFINYSNGHGVYFLICLHQVIDFHILEFAHEIFSKRAPADPDNLTRSAMTIDAKYRISHTPQVAAFNGSTAIFAIVQPSGPSVNPVTFQVSVGNIGKFIS